MICNHFLSLKRPIKELYIYCQFRRFWWIFYFRKHQIQRVWQHWWFFIDILRIFYFPQLLGGIEIATDECQTSLYFNPFELNSVLLLVKSQIEHPTPSVGHLVIKKCFGPTINDNYQEIFSAGLSLVSVDYSACFFSSQIQFVSVSLEWFLFR